MKARFPTLLTLLSLILPACGTTQQVAASHPVSDLSDSTAAESLLPTLPEPELSSPTEPLNAIDSTITKVTVYSDRALLTRQATVELSPDPVVYAFTKLPGWVDDGSVRVGVSAGNILDVRVQRTFLARSSDQTYKTAQDQYDKLANQLTALDDELAILAAEQDQIESIRAFSMEKLTHDSTNGKLGVESYGSVVNFVSDSLRTTAEARRATQLKRNELLPELEAARLSLYELDSLMNLEQTTILVTLASQQHEPCTIDVSYLMPGATWEPVHELRVESDQSNVELSSYAVVTQTSGEDWTAAQLSFSTQSSTEAMRIPELEALTLGDTQQSSRVMTSKVSSYSRAEQAYAGQAEGWNKMQAKSQNFEEVYQSNMEMLQITQSRTVQLFQSLEYRGTTAHFQALNTKTVRGDGHPVRLLIGSNALAASQKIVAVPEQSLNAARTLEMNNGSGRSFLPGSVSLYQDGAFVGMTELDFIADGENFALFLGFAEHLKLSRSLDRKRSSIIRKKRNLMQVSFIISVENLSDAATSVSLADRIPVSENKDIVVSNVRIKPEASPDSKGLFFWELKLAPKEKQVFELSYQIEYPPSLILETQQRDYYAPSPSSPARRKSMQIEDQVMDLEMMF
ncbi:MAG: mucoidy inhibitor MuiA family protein [Myxococcota bacterium]|jgi:uncharacterized protein (TIGR02231 family)|nr:mucoidy inhibitor MuiA family protein [Myxococcota bacterium]